MQNLLTKSVTKILKNAVFGQALVKIRDLEKSRDKWKAKAVEAKVENQELKKLSRLTTAEGKKKAPASG